MQPEVEREIIAWLERPKGAREKLQDALWWVFFVLWFLSFVLIWSYGEIVSRDTGAVYGSFWFSLALASFGCGFLQACNERIRLWLYTRSFKRMVHRLGKGVSVADVIGVVKRWLYIRGNKEKLSSWFKILAVKRVDPQKRALYGYGKDRVLYDESPIPEQCYSCCTQHGLTEVPLQSQEPKSRTIRVCTNCQAQLGSSGVGEGFWGGLQSFCLVVGLLIGLFFLIASGGLYFRMFGVELSFFYLTLSMVVLAYVFLQAAYIASPGASEMRCWLGVNDYIAIRYDGAYYISFRNEQYGALLPVRDYLASQKFDQGKSFKSKH